MADLNPSSLVTNGAVVTDSNPLPATVSLSAPASANGTLNPRSFVVNGQAVSTTNPLPITVS